MKPGRNDPCSCGSGKKYKKCCQGGAGGRVLSSDFIPAVKIPDAEFAQLATLYNAARYSDLEKRTRILIAQYPDSGFLWKVLGSALQKQGKDALAAMQKVVELMPQDAEARINLGRELHGRGQNEAAAASYRHALLIAPDHVDACILLGIVLKDMGQLDQVVTCFRQALAIRPDYAEIHSNLGNALLDLGCLDEAIESYRRALVLKPDYAEAHSNLANALVEAGQPQNAVLSSRRALALSPDFADAHNHLGNALKALGQFDSAAESYRRAVEINPDFAVAHNNLGTALQDMGRLDEAEASYCRAMQIKPDYADAYSNLLYFYAYHATVDSSSYLGQARLWEQIGISECEHQAVSERLLKRMSLEGRRLRVGYVSGDFCQHAVSYFIEQIFSHHDKSRIELFAYSNTRLTDIVTERLKALAEHWIVVTGWSVFEIRRHIEADGIDVLIDLSGHTAQNCLKVFAQRAAPVQAHYLGYFASTGLKAMDYWIGDAVLTPPETDSHFSERVWRLPRVWVSYEGKPDLPVSGWYPDEEGTIWLGSFNNLAKLTPQTLSLWARVLHALPEGKLLLKTKALVDEVNCQRILKVMSGHGVDTDRIELQDGSNTVDWYSHMAYYDRLDIALDPIGGVGGGTTTCDALWMGVPVITLEGDRMASRMTSSMLKALGQDDWVARSEVEYVNKVVTLARDIDSRRRLRKAQRVHMAESALCDARGLVQCLEHAYFDMYQRWCDLRA